MSRGEDSEFVVPSVFDRMDASGAAFRSRSHLQMLQELRSSVMRDVGNLLNTRRRSRPHGEELTELVPSVMDYGLPDITGADFVSQESREEFRVIVENALRRYEPRFSTVKVTLLDNRDTTDRTLRFRIDAMLRAEPAPEPVAFDSILEPILGTFQVRGARQ